MNPRRPLRRDVTAPSSVVGDSGRVLHDWRVWLRLTLLSASTILACQGCPTAAPPVDSEPDLTVVGPDPCLLGVPVELPDSVGSGPVRLDSHEGGIHTLFQGGGHSEGSDHQLHVVEVDASGVPIGVPRLVAAGHEGALEAEAIGVYGRSVGIVGRDSGGRRAYFYHAVDDGDFVPIPLDTHETLDRRTSVALVAPRAGGGLQAALQVSGEPSVAIGRLAGGLFPTREVPLPVPGAPISAAAGFDDRLGLLVVERADAGLWRVVLRELEADGTPAAELELATLPDDHRVEWTHLTPTEDGYRAFWAHWRRGRFGVDTADVPRVGGTGDQAGAAPAEGTGEGEGEGGAGAPGTPPAEVHELFRADRGQVVRSADVASSGDEIVLVWEQEAGGVSTLFAATYDMAGQELHRESLRAAAQGTIADLALVARDVGGYLLAWREREPGSLRGAVRATELVCLGDDDGDATGAGGAR